MTGFGWFGRGTLFAGAALVLGACVYVPVKPDGTLYSADDLPPAVYVYDYPGLPYYGSYWYGPWFGFSYNYVYIDRDHPRYRHYKDRRYRPYAYKRGERGYRGRDLRHGVRPGAAKPGSGYRPHRGKVVTVPKGGAPRGAAGPRVGSTSRVKPDRGGSRRYQYGRIGGGGKPIVRGN